MLSSGATVSGFDGVEIYSTNGYLLDEFLQSKTNHRTDEYSGNIENRYRILGEVVDAVTSVLLVNRVAAQIASNGGFNDMGSPITANNSSTLPVNLTPTVWPTCM